MTMILTRVTSKRGVPLSVRLDALRERLAEWLERSRTRRSLSRLDDHLLKDIGLTPGDVRRETSKPFWRA